MFSPNFLDSIHNRRLFDGFDEDDAFRTAVNEQCAIVLQDAAQEYFSKLINNYEELMNPPLKRGKYTIGTDLDTELLVQQSKLKEEDSKQCEYVSNRTRLRCQNVRRAAQLKEYGFCEEHRGYIERLRKEGLRNKHIFDPGFPISESYLDLISCDDDETLEPRFSDDFPFVYESLYCDSRIDNDDNPLRGAKTYTDKDVLREQIRSMGRFEAAICEQRTIYVEKHLRLLQQLARLKGQPNQTQLDPVKEGDKLKRLMAMRRDLWTEDWELLMRKKFQRANEESIKASTEQRAKWIKQMEDREPIDEDERTVGLIVREMVELVAASKSRRGRPCLSLSHLRVLSRRQFLASDQALVLPQSIVEIMGVLRQQVDDKRRGEEELAKKRMQQQLERQNRQRPVPYQPILRALDQPSSSTAALPMPTTQPIRNRLEPIKTRRRESMPIQSSQPPPPLYHYQIICNQTAPSRKVSFSNSREYLSSSSGTGSLSNSFTFTGASTSFTTSFTPSPSMVNNGSTNNSIIQPIPIDKSINPGLLDVISHQLDNGGDIICIGERSFGRKRKAIEEDPTQVCARIDRPWDGKRKALEETVPTNNNNNHAPLQPPNKVAKVSLPTETRTATAGTNNNNYRQYLTKQRLMPTNSFQPMPIRPIQTARQLQAVPSIQPYVYGHSPSASSVSSYYQRSTPGPGRGRGGPNGRLNPIGIVTRSSHAFVEQPMQNNMHNQHRRIMRTSSQYQSSQMKQIRYPPAANHHQSDKYR